MKKEYKIAFLILLIISLGLLGLLIVHASHSAVLNPAGLIGKKERDLFFIITFLMLIIVVPVLILTTVFAWKYREGNKKAKYSPEWSDDYRAEWIWWGFPCIITAVIAVITWKSCHDLDPFKPLVSDVKPVRIQVVALQWKWLFIYPEEGIATVNFIQFPEKTPINFEITSDAPMNSFWIPKLGGQIYAMPGMNTKLHLIANEEGSYRGSSANLSGNGFADMVFTAKSSSQEDFESWVKSVKKSPKTLSSEEYQKLSEPSEKNPIILYSQFQSGLYDWIVMKYMHP